MKVCKFCGTENRDDAPACSACGAPEFKHKCANCGTVFDKGNYCPTCGVRAGAVPKHCPNCGATYFSAACPDCGYTPARARAPIPPQPFQPMPGPPPQSQPQQLYSPPPPRRPKRSNIGWWILGWIVFFPIPLTILIGRAKKLPKWARVLLIAALWAAMLGLGHAQKKGNVTRESSARPTVTVTRTAETGTAAAETTRGE